MGAGGMERVDPETLHPDFERVLSDRPLEVQVLYRDIRRAVLDVYPDSNELLYHTHALTSVYSPSRQLKHAFCHIPIYANHINLGFNAGTRLEDPAGLLEGTGALIRHVPVRGRDDLNTPALTDLIERALAHALDQLGKPPADRKRMISKIKT